jgi:hypothetical protein
LFEAPEEVVKKRDKKAGEKVKPDIDDLKNKFLKKKKKE